MGRKKVCPSREQRKSELSQVLGMDGFAQLQGACLSLAMEGVEFRARSSLVGSTWKAADHQCTRKNGGQFLGAAIACVQCW